MKRSATRPTVSPQRHKNPASGVEETLRELKSLADPAAVAGMRRFGIGGRLPLLGVSIAKLRPLARRLGRDQDLSLALWSAGFHETRLLNIPLDLKRLVGRLPWGLDLPLAPWEAVLGASVEVPTLEGAVRLKVPAGTKAGQKLRLSKRGLPKRDGEGDLYAVVQIAVPAAPTARERELFEQLAKASQFDPRAHFGGSKETA